MKNVQFEVKSQFLVAHNVSRRTGFRGSRHVIDNGLRQPVNCEQYIFVSEFFQQSGVEEVGICPNIGAFGVLDFPAKRSFK